MTIDIFAFMYYSVITVINSITRRKGHPVFLPTTETGVPKPKRYNAEG